MTKQNELIAEYDASLDGIISGIIHLDLAEDSEDEASIQLWMDKLQSQVDRRDRCVVEIESMGGYIEKAVVFFP